MFKIQSAALKKYPYIISLDRSKEAFTKQKQVIGEIENRHTQETIAVILLDDDSVEQSKFRSMFVTYNSKFKVFVICINQKQLKDFQSENGISYFGLFHELGHIHYGHVFKNKNRTQDEIRRERIEAILMGKVVKDELEADAFAAEYVGNLTAVLALQKMREDRRMRDIQANCQNGRNAVLALKEYDYRIIAIKGNG